MVSALPVLCFYGIHPTPLPRKQKISLNNPQRQGLIACLVSRYLFSLVGEFAPPFRILPFLILETNRPCIYMVCETWLLYIGRACFFQTLELQKPRYSYL